MKSLLLNSSILLGALMAATPLFAETFTADVDGHSIEFTIDKARTNAVELSSVGTQVYGELNIPATVSYADTEYSVVGVGDYAFFGQSHLTYISLPETVTSIGEDAFSSTSIEDLVIPDSVTELGDEAFSGCETLRSVIIGTGVTEIPRSAFANCWDLEEVYAAGDVTSIGAGAFYADTAIRVMGFESLEPPTLGDGAFMAVPDGTPVYVPASAIDTYKNTTGWDKFSYYDIATGIKSVKRIDSADKGIFTMRDGTLNVASGEPVRIQVYSLDGRLVSDTFGTSAVIPDGPSVVCAAGRTIKLLK